MFTMSGYTLSTGSTISCPEGVVLAPDIVTEELALTAAFQTNVVLMPQWERPPRFLELGVGSGAFSRFVLDIAKVHIDVTGIDSSQAAISVAADNLAGHPNLSSLRLINGDWHDDTAFADGPFDCIYFNPPYLHLPHRGGKRLRDEFAHAPHEAVFSDEPDDEYRTLLPRIVTNLAVGGLAIVRYPGDGSLTFAGEDVKEKDNPWMNAEEIDRLAKRLVARYEWQWDNMPPDTRSFMWRTRIDDRRVNAEIFTRIGDDIRNAPKLIQDMEAYWSAY